jgi:SAM-dependent methyltransferase
MVVCPDCLRAVPGLSITRCQACGWERLDRDGIPDFLSSSDRDAALFSRYAENYDTIADEDLKESIQPTAYLDVQAERLYSYVGDLKGRRVCEIGVGQGRLFEQMRQARPTRLAGVDIAQAYLARFVGLDGVDVLVANAENLPFRSEFDLIVASDVLEHVLNVGDFLVSVRDALVDGGQFVVRVPYKEDLTPYARRKDCPYEFVHLRNFARDNLRDLLERAGLLVKRMGCDGFNAGRARQYISRTLLGRGLFYLAVVRPRGDDGVARIDPRIGRLMMVPQEITAVAQRRS